MRAELPGKEMMAGSIKPRRAAGAARGPETVKHGKQAFSLAAEVTSLAGATGFH